MDKHRFFGNAIEEIGGAPQRWFASKSMSPATGASAAIAHALRGARTSLGYLLAVAMPLAVAWLSSINFFTSDAVLLLCLVMAIVASGHVGGLGAGILATVAAVLLSKYPLPAAMPVHARSLSYDWLLLLSWIGLCGSVLMEIVRRQRLQLLQAWQSARMETESRRASDERFSTVFHCAPVAIMLVRLGDGQLVDVNSAFMELWGYTRAQVLGSTSTQLNLWIEPDQLIQRLRENRNADAHEVQIRHCSGEARDVLASVALIHIDAAAHMLVTAADITGRKRAQQMEHIAHHDTLTNLPNRLLLWAKLRDALDRTMRGAGPNAVLFIDLDRFKQVNDTLGHDAGDELLRLASMRLKGRIRATDTLARLGGDEFVVLLENLPDPHEAEVVALDLVRQMLMPFVLRGNREVRIGASVGISHLTAQVADVDVLIQQADTALYAAKSAGRNTVRVYL